MCSFQPTEMHDGFGLMEQGRSEETSRAHEEHPTALSKEDVRITGGILWDSPPNSLSSTVSPVECEGWAGLTCVAPSPNIAPPVDQVPPEKGVGQRKVEESLSGLPARFRPSAKATEVSDASASIQVEESGSQGSQPASGLSAKVTEVSDASASIQVEGSGFRASLSGLSKEGRDPGVSPRLFSLFKGDGRTGVTVPESQGSSEKGVKILREKTEQQKGLQSSQENTLPECVGNIEGEVAQVTSVRLRASMEGTSIEPGFRIPTTGLGEISRENILSSGAWD